MRNPSTNMASNIWLAHLGEADFELLAPYLVRETLDREQVLAQPNTPIDHLWFPEGGVVSVVAISRDGTNTEVGIIGREGFTGLTAILGRSTSPFQTYMQIGDTTALKLPTQVLLSAMRESASLQTQVLRYVQAFQVQVAQGVVSQAHECLEARLARWLLMCHDRVDGDVVELTHAFMAMMVASERTGVTMALHIIEGAGVIRAERGRITIRDRSKLEELAGEAYGTAEAEYRRLIAPFGKTSETQNGVLLAL